MSRRQRWTPVKGTANRIYDPVERLALGALDLSGHALFAGLRVFGLGRPKERPALDEIRDVLVLRLDRIGDVVMSRPALHDLRAAMPNARLRLAVGQWSEPIARTFPVDEVLVWSAPWVGRKEEGALGYRELFDKAWSLRADRIGLGLDLQGDVRASALLWASGAQARVGYANTGGAYLLTQVVPLDETVPWVEQNRRAVALATGQERPFTPIDPLTDADRSFADAFLRAQGLLERRPLVGLHPSGGRRVKQWPIERWRSVGARLQAELGATILVTGSAADRRLAAELAAGMSIPPVDLTGRLDVRQSLAVIARLDLFLSPDTGPMHLACAAGTPSVTVFGPSDPVRYFTGGAFDGDPARHVVVRHDLWCAPCNRIRRPPAECDTAEPPECLRLVTVDEVFAAAKRLLLPAPRAAGDHRTA